MNGFLIFVCALALASLFALADFVTGRDYIKNLGLKGRSIWYVGPALALLMLAFGLKWVAVVVAWAVWRSVLGWAEFGGRMDIKTWRDAGAVALRDLILIIPAMVAFPLMFGTPWTASLGGWLWFTLFATGANAWFGHYENPNHDLDPFVDLAHGAAYGFTAGVLALIGMNA